ncbi:MAG: hypothetical protein KME43_23905 [Myxacorys chilensis ATA2-1-KO14]|nr:hypothetical protein [Myxacorys chilensis ATA2-1-KO14]
MNILPSANTGEYIRSQFYHKPPKALAEEKGISLPELLKQMEPQPTSEGSGA